MEVTFLGTSSMVPTKDRNVQSILFEMRKEKFLVDCGEGTQRQMSIAGTKRASLKKIFITHWHGDHVSGLVGLIQTLGNILDDGELEIWGPPGTKKHMDHLLKSAVFDLQMNIKIHEVDQPEIGLIHETEDYAIYAANLEHSTPVLGYRIVEPARLRVNMELLAKQGVPEGPHIADLAEGKDIEYDGKKIKATDVTYEVPETITGVILDTVPAKNCIPLAEHADLLICESTYLSDLQDKAVEFKHMTAADAAKIASNAGVKQLYLTHFSQRYKDVNDLLQEASDIFPASKIAHDFSKVTVKPS